MHSNNIPLVFIVAFLTSTSLGLHPLVLRARRSLDVILARQLNSAECSSLCTTVDTTVTSCTTPSCLCTTVIAASLQTCINCAVGDDPSVGVVSSAQSIIDTFENICSTVAGVPSVTINTNPGTSQSTPTAIVPSTIVPSTVVIPATTVSQIVIGPSSTTSAPTIQAVSSVGSTSTASIGGFPFQSSASPNKMITLHWTVALLGLAAGNLLVF